MERRVLFKNPRIAGIMAGIFIAILLWIGWWSGIWERLELVTLDLRFLMRPSSSSPSPITVVAIDQKSLTRLGKWPWPRSYHARLIRQIKEAGARVVGLDIIFSERDEKSPEEDKELIEAIGQSGLVILPAYSKEEVENLPFSPLRERAAGIGSAAFFPDRDGVLRKVKIGQRIKRDNYWAFGIEILRHYLGLGENDIYLKDKNKFKLGKIEIPMNEEGKMAINYRKDGYGRLSYVEVLGGNFPRELLKGKVVLIGGVAEGLTDFFHTPINARMPGVEVHAHVINSILQGDFLTGLPFSYYLLALFLLSSGMGILFFSLNWHRSIIIVLFLLGGWLTTNLVFFTQGNLILDYLPFTFAILLNFTGGIIYQNKYIQEKAEVLDVDLSSLYQMGKTTGLTSDLSQLVQLVSRITSESMDSSICVLMLKEEENENLKVREAYGMAREAFSDLSYKVGEGIAGEVAASRKGMIIKDSRKYEEIRQFDKERRIGSSLYIPLMAAGKTIGVLQVHKKAKNGFTADNLRFLFTIGTQMAIAIENSRLYREVKEGFRSTIEALVAAEDVKDEYTRGHSQRVEKFSLLIGKKLGLSSSELEFLQYAALLHDIGKIGIPREMINKNGPLSDEEWKLMKSHPHFSEKILAPIKFLEPSFGGIRSHHEKLDGSGYPDQLKDDEIPLFAQIICVADVFDALTSTRAYRPALPLNTALEILEKGKGTQFNSQVVDAFLSLPRTKITTILSKW